MSANPSNSADARWMRLAIETCFKGIEAGQTPFGAAIVRSGGDEVLATGHNVVVGTTDITAHGEVTTIRIACRNLGGIDLGGYTIYSTCEPCPMCFAACHWANLDRIVYGTSIADAADCGFRELTISNEQMKSIGGSPIQLTGGCLRDESMELFKAWKQRADRKVY
jgi:tRNA(Arg) A34 adenosine deaminase TadA